MKQIKILTMAIVAIFVMSACNSTDSLVDQYVEACKNHDQVKAMKIAEKLEKKKGELTEEQTAILLNASMSLY